DDATRLKLREQLKLPQGIQEKKERKEGDKTTEESGEEGLRLYFNLSDTEGIKLIPDCMKELFDKRRTRGKINDLWDDGLIRIPPGEAGEWVRVLSYVLLAVVGLLSVEWLARKLLRLA